MGVRQAGWDRRGAPDNWLGEVEESDVTVKGEGMEMRMNDDFLDLYQLLTWIRTLLIQVPFKHKTTNKLRTCRTSTQSGQLKMKQNKNENRTKTHDITNYATP